MKVELQNLTIGHSSLSDSVFVGTLNKAKNKWVNKKDVTGEFIGCVISRFNGFKETVECSDGKTYEIQVKEVKPAKQNKKP
jgi:hypothetical protein